MSERKSKFLKVLAALIVFAFITVGAIAGYAYFQFNPMKASIKPPFLVAKTCWELSKDMEGEIHKNLLEDNIQEGDKKFTWAPATGTVYDAETNKPIANAQIRARVNYHVELSLFEPAFLTKEEYTQTDENGRYCVPPIKIHYVPLMSDGWYNLIVYKAGYEAYESRRHKKEKEFRFIDNPVYLSKWDDKIHSKKDLGEQLRIIGCGESMLSRYSMDRHKIAERKTFCREAREEMILACLDKFKANPRTRAQCERYTDDDLYPKKRSPK